MADTALAKPEQRASSRLAQVTGFSDEQIALIAQTVAPGASRLELAWYLYNAKRLGLEPMLKQIYFIRYKAGEPGEIVVGIDGYRAQAEASGVYAGSDDPVFEYDADGQPAGAPSKATVTVWKLVGGQRVPFTASVRWKEFYPGDGAIGAQYRKRPHNQMAVRAESHAIRKGFPYQSATLEAHAEAPMEWRQAAAEDDAAASNPALVARNARRYDEIFSESTEPSSAQVSPSVPGRSSGAAATETSPAPSPPAPGRGELWADNRRLVAKAAELDIPGVATLTIRSTDDVLQRANEDLRARIKAAEDEIFAQVEESRRG